MRYRRALMGRHGSSEEFEEFLAGYRAWVDGGAIGVEGRQDCRDFYNANLGDLSTAASDGLSWNRLGQDFYLTRNRHGAGYWDEKSRGKAVDAALDRLTDAAHVYGSTDY